MSIAYEGTVKVAAVNFKAIVGDKVTNLKNMEDFVANAGVQGVGLVVFPETALTGWALTSETAEALAEKVAGPSTERIADLAVKRDIYVIFGI
jgi:predicted amidohydrolase